MIAVVGGAGFIGSHTARLLADADIPFVVFDNLSNGHREAVAGFELFHGDIRNREDTARFFSLFPIHSVIHFAGSIEVGESVVDPAKFYDNNVIGSWNLLESMRAADVDKIVFSSTAAVYGEPETSPITEDHPQRPASPYGDTKLAVERLLKSYESAYGVRHVILRYFNAGGSDPSGRIGEDHRPETHLVPRILLSVLGRSEFKVFGDDYDTPDGTCVRDYVHVCDLADAHLKAVQFLQGGSGSDVFNLGSGVGFSVKQVVDIAEKVTGAKIDPDIVERRAGDPAVLVASNSKAKTVLKWSPQFANLSDMVTHTWNWLRSHPEGYND